MDGRILIVDDEPHIVRVLRGYFEQAGFAVLGAYDGAEALRVARQERPDLIVLDIMLPRVDGLEVCRTLRRESDVPIIMLTARVEETDTLIGLELGADDYIPKPFSPREVVARARAVLRRVRTPSGAGARDAASATCAWTSPPHPAGGRARVELTPSEFEILRTLLGAPGRVFTRGQLPRPPRARLRGYERTIDTHIRPAPQIGDSPLRRYIQTVHGVGYKMREG